ncbi:hypothetical protein PVAP13_1KG103800 [Panicum virgatum]|uniref:Uncharacterized protein n=1 Tax=Panicum virgatum TaxID=38727 RepID=A0A8T0XMR9_PANVG|nr:hypothetical protein PVAP13_1KG103800 [Panicum virgatum]
MQFKPISLLSGPSLRLSPRKRSLHNSRPKLSPLVSSGHGAHCTRGRRAAETAEFKSERAASAAAAASTDRMGLGGRGIVGERWSQRILWICALGSAVSLYFVAVERQAQNRARAVAEGLKALDGSGGGAGEDV